ncbi:MAG: hypothetical protein IPP96_09425 [Chitinophagaceae bacterium]|nr:hypothetical protein [Chitinophagaceae bacterium]
MSIDINLEWSKRSGHYNAWPDTIMENDKEIKGTVYKVILGAGAGKQETYFVHKGNDHWVINPLESEPLLCDEIRSEIDRIELS